ncbi:MAG: DUF4276 family protein [Deltaproteobacteria bacterium]|nr:DUF4276 family protein [Deltaproteobacteria bacterium]
MLNVIVEDVLSEAVMQRLLSHVGYTGKPTCRVMRGNTKIKKGLPKYVGASRFYPHIVLTDLDQYPCPPALIENWNIGTLPETMLFRVVVREVEAWLMADREGFSTFLNVAKEKVPFDPEEEVDPKQCLFSIVRKSRRRRLIEEIVPTAGAHIGPLYNMHFCSFVRENWQVAMAAENAPSLAKCIERLGFFIRKIDEGGN